MARTAITVQDIDAPFAAVTAGSMDFTFAALDAVNGNYFPCTGREIILFENTDVGAQTVIIDSVADEKNRESDIAAYSLAANDFVAVGVALTNRKGWKQSNGQIYIDTSSANVKVAVLRLPDGYPD
jgi:hypothetical protein